MNPVRESLREDIALKETRYIGKPVRRTDGRAKVTGQAKYSDDIYMPRTNYAKVLRSRYAHAKITKLDVSRAKEMPGVLAVFTAKDIPNNDKYFRKGTMGDTWVLAEEYVRYIGDSVAFIVAEDEETAEQALSLIDVEYEPLPPVVNLREAKEAELLARGDREMNVSMPLEVSRGDVEADFAKADITLSDRYIFPSLSQLHLEPNSVTAVYESGKLTVYCASQVWFHTREDIAAVVGLPEKDIILRPMTIGGAFGARNDQPLPIFASLLAVLTKSTVKMTYTRLEEFLAARPSLQMDMDITVAADKEGHLLSKKTRLLSSHGIHASDNDAVTAIACLRIDNNYKFNSVYVDGTGLYLNHTPTAAYRGFGNPQMHWAFESMLDDLAEKLHMDPTEIRMINYHEAGETGIHGFIYNNCGIKECMRRAKEIMDWDEKKKHRVPGRGIGCASLIHCSGSRAGKPEFSGTSAWLKLESSGALTVLAGECEMGQGITNVCALIVGEELGVDPMSVKVIMGDTELCPFSTGTNGSKLTSNLGNAVLFACRDLKKQLCDALRERCGYGPVELRDGAVYYENNGQYVMSLEQAAYEACCKYSGRPFMGLGRFNPPSELGDRTGYGNLAPSYVFGVQMAEVTVHKDGSFTVDRMVSVHDIGRVIDSRNAAGQVYGGVMQAFGAATTESLDLNKEGVYQANTILEYKAPTVLDMPKIDVGFVETYDQYGPYGAKAIAEPPIIAMAPAISNAIYDAVGVRIHEAPITPQRLREAILAKKNLSAGDKEDGNGSN